MIRIIIRSTSEVYDTIPVDVRDKISEAVLKATQEVLDAESTDQDSVEWPIPQAAYHSNVICIDVEFPYDINDAIKEPSALLYNQDLIITAITSAIQIPRLYTGYFGVWLRPQLGAHYQLVKGFK
jgi:hypothetical protein